MPITRQATEQSYEAILKLLGCGDAADNPEHPIRLALDALDAANFFGLFTLARRDLSLLRYPDPKNKTSMLTLTMGHANALLLPMGYRHFHFQKHGTQMRVDDWPLVTVDEFNEYRLSPEFEAYLNDRPLTTSGTTVPSTTFTNTNNSNRYGIVAYKKTIKRDASQFKVFSDKRYWAQWKLHFTATARAQDLQELLDPNHCPDPSDPDDVAVFHAKNEFLFSVFVDKLTTDEGKSYVRQHATTSDAQAIYRDLVAYHTSSTHAQLDTSAKLTWITSVKYGRDRFRGGHSAFIAYFVEQLRLYDELNVTTGAPPLPDEFKRTLLDNAVNPVAELRNVRVTQDTLSSQNNYKPTWDSYLSLLQTAATVLDNAQNHGNSRPDNSTSRKAYQTSWVPDDDEPLFDTGPSFFDDDGDEPGEFEIDTPLATVTAYAARQTRSRTDLGHPSDPSTRLPDTVFKQLTVDDRRTWARLGLHARRLILSGRSGDPTTPDSSMGSAGISNVSQRRILLADQSPSPTTTPLHPTSPENPSTTVLTNLSDRRAPVPGDIRRLLSTSSAVRGPSSTLVAATHISPSAGEDIIEIDGTRYRRVNMTRIYQAYNSRFASNSGALIDRGANGGLAGNNCRIIAKSPDRYVNIEGIDKHQVTHIPIVTCGAYVITRKHGPVILVLHQFAGLSRGPTIISAAQVEAFGNRVNDRSLKVDANGQCIITNDGYELPLHIRHGLPYLDIRPYTDKEFDELPHVVLTSDVDWDPDTMDGEFPRVTSDKRAEEFFDASSYDNGTNFDAYGNYIRGTIIASARILHDDPILQDTILPDHLMVRHDFDHDPLDDVHIPLDEPIGNGDTRDPTVTTEENSPLSTDPETTQLRISSPNLSKEEPDPESLRPFFAFLPAEVVKRTLRATTQYARIPMGETMIRYYKSPFPALNVARRDEDLLVDIIYSDIPAVDDGSTSAAIYSGKISHVLDVFGMKTDRQFVNTLEDIIRDRGAPSRLLSDHALTIRSTRVLDILRALYIGQWTSEPHRQNQNTMERRYQTAKRITNIVMERSGCPPSCWLLCMQYVCTVLNCTACKSLDWKIPLTVLLGTTIDVSPLLRFHWYQPVLYSVDQPSFPSESREALGHFVGIATHCGHTMTFKVLTDDTEKVIFRSQVRPADDPKRPNLRLTDLFNGEPPAKIFVKSKADPEGPEQFPNLDEDSGEIEHDVSPTMVLVDTSDLIGRTFLMDGNEPNTKHRARIVELVNDGIERTEQHRRFKLSVNNDQYEDIMAYNEILQHLEKDQEQEILWRFKRILSHQGPLIPSHPDYKGSSYNVQVEWENGEITFEPLGTIAADDPVSCAIYAREHDLLDTDGWKRFRRDARREKKFKRMVNQAKLRSFRTAPVYKYGFEIPRDYAHAMALDRLNGNDNWKRAATLEFDQLLDYKTFIDKGHIRVAIIPPGYKKIRVHLVFDVKHDGRHKVRCVADGHLTDVPIDSVYSGVVSLRGLRIMIFTAILNLLEIWATDVGNAYLEAMTKEKVYIIAGPEFGPKLEGHVLLIFKALYGLRSSGKQWHERFSDCLRAEGFAPCKAEPDIWMRPSQDRSHYEMVAVYVDDLAIGMKDPEAFLKVLTTKYNFKLKGSGPIEFHLGCDFNKDPDGTIYMAPKQYIERIVKQYESMFGSKPKTKVTSPLAKNDHPEIDESPLLDQEGIRKYQSLIGSLQWAVTLGRFDIATAVMTLSSFRALPRLGHLDRAKRIVSYLYRYKEAKLRFRVHEPDLSDIVIPEYDWSTTTYGNVQEDIPTDIPTPLGNPVVTVSYIDANLLHDLVTGRSVTGILHFMNGTLIDWYSKKIPTVETATYGAEFASARTCVEQLVDLRNTLRYLGVPLRETSFMFGDNESVVNSSIQPHAKLHKRHNALSFHRVREAIASRKYAFVHIAGENNPADIVSKHWSYDQVWHMIKSIMFISGDTVNGPARGDRVWSPVDVSSGSDAPSS